MVSNFTYNVPVMITARGRKQIERSREATTIKGMLQCTVQLYPADDVFLKLAVLTVNNKHPQLIQVLGLCALKGPKDKLSLVYFLNKKLPHILHGAFCSLKRV